VPVNRWHGSEWPSHRTPTACGSRLAPGNNGGDGLEAAIHLLRQGRQVEVALRGDAATLPPDAADALARAVPAGVCINAAMHVDLDADDIAIHALLGLRASRAPQGAIAELTRALNALARRALAVDVPRVSMWAPAGA